MMKWDNGREVKTYKVVLSDERMVSFRKNDNSNTGPIIDNYQYLSINSNDYCVSKICEQHNVLKYLYPYQNSYTMYFLI